MSGVIKKVLIIGICVAAIGGIIVYKYLDSRIYYNEDSVNGNTVGNLYGDGLFCEANGVVYFANPNDDFALYQMKPDESDVVKICDDRVYFINADEHYIYYSRNKNNDESAMSFLNVNISSLCRINTNGKKITILDDDICNALSLSGNTIYYYHYDTDEATTLYSVGIDGENRLQVSNSTIDPRCMVGDRLYYSGVVNDHYIYSRNITTGATSTIFSEPAYMPIVVGDYLYYMDLDDNNRIARVTLSSGEKITLSSYGTSDYNVAGNYIYYQSIKGDPDGLYKIDLSTGEESLIVKGQYYNINVTSKKVYFYEFTSDMPYHCSLTGDRPSIFSPAIEFDE